MPITTPKELTNGIDELGNSLAIFFSDTTSLQYIREIFSDTVVGTVANILTGKPNIGFDSIATLIKTCIASSCLRAIQFAIYADDTVEESELNNAYPILKPLASFYQRYVGDRYSRFENLQRKDVFDFLHTHMTDHDFLGGRISQTKEFYEGKYLTSTELLAMQNEHVAGCLSLMSNIFTKNSWASELFFSIVQYPLYFIISDGKGCSQEDLRVGKDIEINRVASFIQSLTKVLNSINNKFMEPINNPVAKRNFSEMTNALKKITYVMGWWNQNKPNIPTTSHFSDSWFVGSDFAPTSQGSIVSPSNVVPISIQHNQSPDDILKEAMEELNNLEGLASVKKEVGNLVAFLKIQKQRSEQGMKTSSQALHYVFHGNPGTGKTTVARILAKIFYGFGILKTANFTETDRSGLVAGFVGQTAIKTDEVIRNSLDGVLFIDEAYTLSKQESGQDYGQEAIDTLLKRMEDNRDRLIVIVAGYPILMKQFILSNPGLSSRFTRSITFEDYTVSEMCRIYATMCKKDEYTLSKEALAYSCVLFGIACSQKNEHFGNGRFVRNVYENTTMKQSARLATEAQVTKKALATLEYSDIPFEMISNFDINNLDLSQSRWTGCCPSCQKSFAAKLDFIGQQVKCKCGQKFEFPWWNPVPTSIGGIFPNIFNESSTMN
jgi:Holliday junction resolvasome RuvABC ATP-dependent DNA helicase subunit